MAKVTAKKEHTNNAAAPAPGASVDQIRDIIFGPQMQEYDGRFKTLESRLLSESEALRNELTSRFDELSDKMEAALRTEQGDRGAAADRLQKNLDELGKTLEDKLDAHAEKAAEDLRATKAAILEKLARLDDAKTGRDALAGLLHKLAAQLENGGKKAAAHGAAKS